MKSQQDQQLLKNLRDPISSTVTLSSLHGFFPGRIFKSVPSKLMKEVSACLLYYSNITFSLQKVSVHCKPCCDEMPGLCRKGRTWSRSSSPSSSRASNPNPNRAVRNSPYSAQLPAATKRCVFKFRFDSIHISEQRLEPSFVCKLRRAKCTWNSLVNGLTEPSLVVLCI